MEGVASHKPSSGTSYCPTVAMRLRLLRLSCNDIAARVDMCGEGRGNRIIDLLATSHYVEM
jgi:hypothetical protein